MNNALLHRLSPLLRTEELPALGPQPRDSRLALPALEEALNKILKEEKVAAERAALIRSLAFLYHDHLNESHTLSQDIHSAEGSYLHGMMHRREPDFWNAKYWFIRVGELPFYSALGEQARTIIEADRSYAQILQAISKGGKWNPQAFVDACEMVSSKPPEHHRTLQHLQQAEFQALLTYFCSLPK